MSIFIILMLIGVVSATLGSIIGLGGGIIIVPALIYVSPIFFPEEISISTAVGTSLTVLIFTALSSTLTFIKQKRVDFRSGWLLFITSGPAAIVGASLTHTFQEQSFQLAFGIFMLLMAVLMILKERLKPPQINWKIKRSYTDLKGETTEYGYNILPALMIGFGVGLVSGLFGIGGGSLFVPAMVLLFRYPPHVATATSMFVMFLSAILGSATHIALREVDWLSFAALAPGALFGGWLGAWIAGRLSGNGLMRILLIALLLLSLRMIWAGINGMN